jgi:hypothetical protein
MDTPSSSEDALPGRMHTSDDWASMVNRTAQRGANLCVRENRGADKLLHLGLMIMIGTAAVARLLLLNCSHLLLDTLYRWRTVNLPLTNLDGRHWSFKLPVANRPHCGKSAGRSPRHAMIADGPGRC